MPRFNAAELAQVSPLKLGPDLIIELVVEHKEEGKDTIPRRTRGLVDSVRVEGDARTYIVIFPGMQRREVSYTRLQIVANTDRRDWDFEPLRTRVPTHR